MTEIMKIKYDSFPEPGTKYHLPSDEEQWRDIRPFWRAFIVFMIIMFCVAIAYKLYPAQMTPYLEAGGMCVLFGILVFSMIMVFLAWHNRRYYKAHPEIPTLPPDPPGSFYYRWYKAGALLTLAIIILLWIGRLLGRW